ncbi:MAG: radical SAM protein [Candidatus Omnitrophica bacterium]|nr:radical SAM protein [Candidatus Omnitrophota bacterium]
MNPKKLKILLMEPLYPSKAAWGSVKSQKGYLPPMGMISIYTRLKYRGYDVEFLDTILEDLHEASLAARLRSARYDVVALPVYTPTADYAFATGAFVKKVLPDCKLVMGNIHVTTMPELSMQQCPEIDFIILQEGENTLEELVLSLAGGDNNRSGIKGLVYRDGKRIAVNPPRGFIDDLDSLPPGLYSDIDLKRYVPHPSQYVTLPSYPFITQRGCPYCCTYCGASIISGKKARRYTPERVIEELRVLKDEKGARGIYFQDSTFTMNRAYIMKLMDLMIKAKLGLKWICNTRADTVDPELLDAMYKAGGRKIVLGIESGNQASLDIVQKNTTVEKQTRGVEWIRKAGFKYVTSFIICLPGETEEMVRNTIRYAKTLNAEMAMFYLPVPYPGTALYERCKADGGLRQDAKWSDFLSIDFDNPVYINPNFGIEGMKYWYKRAFLEYYGSPRIWLANLRSMDTTEDFRRLMRGGQALISLVAKNAFFYIRHQFEMLASRKKR